VPQTILLLGRKGILVEDATAQTDDPNITVYGGTGLEDVKSVLAETHIDHVFMGAGIEIEKRLEIVKEIFSLSQATNIHLKNATSGPAGLLPFVKRVLVGFE
jgi:hypothetical protein